MVPITFAGAGKSARVASWWHRCLVTPRIGGMSTTRTTHAWIAASTSSDSGMGQWASPTGSRRGVSEHHHVLNRMSQALHVYCHRGKGLAVTCGSCSKCSIAAVR